MSTQNGRHLNRVIRGIDRRLTNEAADRLSGFGKPALIAWSRDDRLFPPEHARPQRLVAGAPRALPRCSG